jgi:hypothetical protein
MTKLMISTILGLLVVPLLLPAGVAAETFHFSSRGQFANASFQGTDPSDCIETFVSVGAVDRLVKEDGSPTQRESWVLVSITQQDVCTGAPMIVASGIADLAPDQFQVDKLDAATLNASITVADSVSGSSFAVDIALAWQATADPVRFREHILVHEPGGMVNARVDCTGALCLGRGGTVAGTVTDGSTDFTPAPGAGALGTAKSARVEVLRG